MKISLSLFILGLFISCGSNTGTNKQLSSGELQGNITISGAFALYPLAVKWGNEFTRLHPHVNFDIQGGGAGKGITDVLSENVDLGMVSRDIHPVETKRGILAYPVAMDAVIATMNINNPVRQLVLQHGIAREKLIRIFLKGDIRTWGKVVDNSFTDELRTYTRSDAAGAPETWANYLGGSQEELKGTAVFGDPGLAEAVMKDRYGIGYNNIAYLYDHKTKLPFEGLMAVPIDLNNNGQLDSLENFYSNLDSLNAAISDGRYPSPPARPLWFVTKNKPTNPVIIAFLNWVMTDGQKFVSEAGYVSLKDEQLKSGLELLNKEK